MFASGEGGLRHSSIAQLAVNAHWRGMNELLFVMAAGFLAGAMNAAAGGGTFVTLPALVLIGLPAQAANISSTIALWPAMLASAWAYRPDFKPFGQVSLTALLVTSLLGGCAGAVLLLVTPAKAFDAVVPWLLLLATLTLAFGRDVGEALRRRVRIGPGTLLVVQFVLAIYGGYFGGAVGIMMMAAWTLLSTADITAMNPVRTILVSAMNAVAVLCFIVAGDVWWRETLAMLAGALLGGYGGARATRLLNPRHVRVGTILFTAAITLAFFLRAR
jgi:uncharacterized protein